MMTLKLSRKILPQLQLQTDKRKTKKPPENDKQWPESGDERLRQHRLQVLLCWQGGSTMTHTALKLIIPYPLKLLSSLHLKILLFLHLLFETANDKKLIAPLQMTKNALYLHRCSLYILSN